MLGNSGLKVSRLALGCMSFGEPSRGAHAWTLTSDKSNPIIRKALELGINFFDTANVYSLGSSEEILGNALKQYTTRSDVVIATKVFHKMSDSPLSGGLSRKEIFQQIDDSLKRLQTDYVDLYIIHRWDYDTPIEETMEALHDLVKMGKVRYIGASSMHAWQFVKAQYIATLNGWTRFISMQNHYNLINREEEREMLPYCINEGVGVTPWSPLARGKLTNKGETSRAELDEVKSWLYESAKQSDDKIIEVLKEVALSKNFTTAQVALSWLLNKPGVVAPIIGATSVEQLSDNAKCLDISLSKEDILALEQYYVPHATPEYK
jgi:aryl-alcohol dehydrogenase-like predicted oxidoreductase